MNKGAVFIALAFLMSGCENPDVAAVKESSIQGSDLTYGQALSGAHCSKVSWESDVDDRNRDVVISECHFAISKSDVAEYKKNYLSYVESTREQLSEGFGLAEVVLKTEIESRHNAAIKRINSEISTAEQQVRDRAGATGRDAISVRDSYQIDLEFWKSAKKFINGEIPLNDFAGIAEKRQRRYMASTGAVHEAQAYSLAAPGTNLYGFISSQRNLSGLKDGYFSELDSRVRVSVDAVDVLKSSYSGVRKVRFAVNEGVVTPLSYLIEVDGVQLDLSSPDYDEISSAVINLETSDPNSDEFFEAWDLFKSIYLQSQVGMLEIDGFPYSCVYEFESRPGVMPGCKAL